MGRVLFVIAIVLSFLAYIYLYWRRLRYLIWKWRVIPLQEQMERKRMGLCIRCGYDMRATPERCPECGLEARRE